MTIKNIETRSDALSDAHSDPLSDALSGFVIETPLPAGENWFVVKSPFEDLKADRVGRARAMTTPAQKNKARREARKEAKASPYAQVSLQYDARYQAKLKAILKK